jgi:hypothetical protein
MSPPSPLSDSLIAAIPILSPSCVPPASQEAVFAAPFVGYVNSRLDYCGLSKLLGTGK